MTSPQVRTALQTARDDAHARTSEADACRERRARLIARAIILVAALVLVCCFADLASAQGISFGPRHSGASALSRPAGVFGWIFAQQAIFYRSLSNLIRASKASGAAVWGLLGLSFLYGIFHAAGPGHGKAVISSYLLANGETWKRGVILSFASSTLQSIIAIAIVVIGAILLGVTGRVMGDAVRFIEITSYAFVILIGARLLWVKGHGFIRSCRDLMRPKSLGAAAALPIKLSPHVHRESKMRCTCGHLHYQHSHVHDHHGHEDCDHASAWGHAHGPEPAELAGAGGWRRGLSAVAAVGARPCSGAIIVLVFALSQDLFWTGVGATLLMGIGTAITVAAIATLAVYARDLAGRVAVSRAGFGTLVMRGIEVGAAAAIIVVGVLLLTGYMASEQLWMFSS